MVQMRNVKSGVINVWLISDGHIIFLFIIFLGRVFMYIF